MGDKLKAAINALNKENGENVKIKFNQINFYIIIPQYLGFSFPFFRF